MQWSGAVTRPACLRGGEAAGHNALRGSGPGQLMMKLHFPHKFDFDWI
jgi:hypothetical protein